MPTSIPKVYLNEAVNPDEVSYRGGAAWLLAIWAVAMLLFGAIGVAGGSSATTDAFQLLAHF